MSDSKLLRSLIDEVASLQISIRNEFNKLDKKLDDMETSFTEILDIIDRKVQYRRLKKLETQVSEN